MPKRYGKETRQMLRMNKYANLYAKQFASDVTGVVIHAYRRGTPGYEVEVIAADGSTLTVRTVSHAQLMSTAERMRKKLQADGGA